MAEQIEVQVVADASGLTKGLTEAEKVARDFKKRAESQTAITASLKLANIREQLSQLQTELKVARKKGDKTAIINVRARSELLKKDLNQANRELNNFLATGDKAKSRLGGLFDQVKPKNFIGGIKQAGASLFGFAGIAGGVAVAIGAVGKALSDATNIAISFESAFTGVEKTLEGTEDQFNQLKEGLLGLTSEIPVTFEEISKIAELGGQLGVPIETVEKFTETVAKLGATTDLTTEEAATAFARISNVLQIPLDKVEELGSVVVALGNNFAATESEIVSITQRLASAGAVAGFSQDELFAIGTALTSVGVNAEAGGTAVSKAFLKINEAVVSGGKDLQGFADTAGVTTDEFKKLFEQDAGQAFAQFVEGLGTQGDAAVGTIEELLGSDVRLKNAFLSLAGSGDTLSSALSLANQELSSLNALNDEAGKRFATTESQLELVNNQIREQQAAIGQGLLPARLALQKARLLGIKVLGKVIKGVGVLLKVFKPLIKVLQFAFKATSFLFKILGALSKRFKSAIKGSSIFRKSVGFLGKTVQAVKDRIVNITKAIVGFVKRLPFVAKIIDNVRQTFEFLKGAIERLLNTTGNKIKRFQIDLEKRSKAKNNIAITANFDSSSAIDGLNDLDNATGSNKKTVDDLNESFEELKETALETSEEMAEGLEGSLDKIKDIDNEIKSIDESLANLGVEGTEKLAERFRNLQEEISGLEENLSGETDLAKRAALIDEISSLEEEANVARSNTTEEALEKIDSLRAETETERILREISEEQAKLQAERDLLQESKDQELQILSNFFDQGKILAAEYAKSFDESLKIPEERLNRLRQLASEIQGITGVSVGQSLANAGTAGTTNNNQQSFQNTFTVNSTIDLLQASRQIALDSNR